MPKKNNPNPVVSLEKENENYYQLLGVETNASVSDIIAAYRKAKAAFSHGSLATYSLIGEQDSQKMLDDLETAYLTLTNPERRLRYDKGLGLSSIMVEDNSSPSQSDTTSPPTALAKVNGEALTKQRERLGYTVDDVARITKIPKRYLNAIESQDFSRLPARVYLHGFVTNLARLYKLDPKATAQAYLDHLEQVKPIES